MVIDVSWGDESQSYVYIRVEGAWEWHEFHRCVTEANRLIRSVEHPVCIVTHMVDAQAQMLSRNAFSEWRKSLEDTPDNLQTVILIPGRPIIQMFIDMSYKVFGRFIVFRFRMASTLEEAEAIVEEILKRSMSHPSQSEG